MYRFSIKFISLFLVAVMLITGLLVSCNDNVPTTDDKETNTTIGQLGGDITTNGGINEDIYITDGNMGDVTNPECNHVFSVKESIMPTEKLFGYKYSTCNLCNKEKTELLDPTADVPVIPNVEMTRLSLDLAEKAALDAEYLFKKNIENGHVDIFNLPYSSASEFMIIREFTLALTKDCKTDMERAECIYKWITDNIEYDSSYTLASPYQSFVDKKAVCFGYTVLMHDMLSSLGIMSVYLSGSAAEQGVESMNINYVIDEMMRPQDANHAWVAFYADGNVIICDPTWHDFYSYLENGGYNISANELSKTHLTTNVNTITVTTDYIDQRLYQNAITVIGDRMFHIARGSVYVGDMGLILNSISYQVEVLFGDKEAENGIVNTVLNNGFYYFNALFKDNMEFWRYALPDGRSYDYKTVLDYVMYMKELCSVDISVFHEEGFFLENGLCYFNNGGELTLITVVGLDKTVTVPSSVNGLPVKKIGNNAFKGSLAEKVIVENGVEVIGEYAFSEVKYLKEITLPQSLKRVETMAFVDTKLTEIAFPSGVTEIMENAVFTNQYLKKVILPSSLKKFTVNPIQQNPSLEEIIISDNENYKSVDGVLYSKDGKELLIYPSGNSRTEYSVLDETEHIGISAFAFSADLKRVNLPNSVKNIDEYSFQWCEALEEIKLSTGLTNLGAYAFYKCAKLKSVIIPDGIKILDATFEDCESLESVTIPASVSKINNAFSFCYALKSITISSDNAYYKIVNGALYTKDGKTLVCYPGGCTDDSFTVADGAVDMQWHAINSNNLKTLILPNGFKDFSSAPGLFVSSLEKLVLPSTVNNMPDLPGTQTEMVIFTDYGSRDEIPASVYIPYHITVYWQGEWSIVNGIPTLK